METIDAVGLYEEAYRKIRDRLTFIPSDLVPNRIIRAWELGGLIVPAWSASEPGVVTRLWANVCVHMASVGVVAYTLASRIEAPIKNEGWSVHEVVEAALIHDAYKRREQEIVQSAKAAGKDPAATTLEAEAASIRFLQESGINARVATIAGMTGDYGLRYLMQNGGCLAEQIVFYADCCVSDDLIVGYKKRFDNLIPHFQPGGRYDFVNEVFLKKHGRTHREVYDGVVIPLEHELAELMDVGNPNELSLAFTPKSLQVEG